MKLGRPFKTAAAEAWASKTARHARADNGPFSASALGGSASTPGDSSGAQRGKGACSARWRRGARERARALIALRSGDACGREAPSRRSRVARASSAPVTAEERHKAVGKSKGGGLGATAKGGARAAPRQRRRARLVDGITDADALRRRLANGAKRIIEPGDVHRPQRWFDRATLLLAGRANQ